MDKQLQYVIIKSVQSKLDPKLIDEHTPLQILNLYNTVDPNIFKGYNFTEVLPVLSNIIAGKIRSQYAKHFRNTYKPIPVIGNDLTSVIKASNKEDEINTHEMLKTMIGSSSETSTDKYMSSYLGETQTDVPIESDDIEINSFLGINDLSTLQLLFNPESLYTHYYVVLDTDYRQTSEESSSITKFSWNYTDSQNLRDGFCNSVGRIRDIIGMRMYQPRVHYLASMDTTAKRVSILVEEFAPQAFIGENGRRFHFLLRPNLQPIAETSIELSTEDYNDGIYSFRKPITTFDSLTISFGDPLVLLEFPLIFDRFMIAFEFTCYKSDK
jgi:hypothetical protein